MTLIPEACIEQHYQDRTLRVKHMPDVLLPPGEDLHNTYTLGLLELERRQAFDTHSGYFYKYGIYCSWYMTFDVLHDR